MCCVVLAGRTGAPRLSLAKKAKNKSNHLNNQRVCLITCRIRRSFIKVVAADKEC
jgi:hypothetical protein